MVMFFASATTCQFVAKSAVLTGKPVPEKPVLANESRTGP
jgi:hypothetical protein